MGVSGPIPARSDQRVRRNQDEGPIEKVSIIGPVVVPELDIVRPHPLVVDLYEALKTSGQAKFYEPSDWQYARLAMHFVNKLVRNSKPSAMMLSSVNTMLTPLLMTEGERRRVRMEVERNQTEGELIDVAEMFRAQLAASALREA